MAMGVPNCNPIDWRLFIESSKRSLKCVLLHNGNILGSIPIGYSVKLKEEYNNLKKILEIINYSAHECVICVDLKMVNFLLGQKSVFTKYPCFLCYWDRRYRNQHLIREKWPPRESLKAGDKNVNNNPLVHTNKIILPHVHIKLGLMKQFINALDKDRYCFRFSEIFFQDINEEKKKVGTHDGTQIRKLLRDYSFTDSMNEEENRALQAFSNVLSNFLGNKKASNYK